MSPSKFPQIPFTLDALVSEIHSILGPDGGLDSEHIDHREIMALMEEYNSKATDWSKYAIFDESRAYTRNLVDDGNGKVRLLFLYRLVQMLIDAVLSTLSSWPWS